MPLPRALVVGYYGMSNYGDDLFGTVFRDEGERILPGYRVEVASAPRSAGRGMPARLAASDSGLGSMLRLTRGIAALARHRMIVLGGGSVLETLSGVRRVQHRLARFTGTRFRAIGVSIGPFAVARDRDEVVAFLSSMDRIVVRDSRSREVAERAGLAGRTVIGGDLAALHTARATPAEQHIPAPGRTPRRVGLALGGAAGVPAATADALVDGLADAIEATHDPARADQVALLVLNTHPVHGDDLVSARAAERLSSRGLDVTVSRHTSADVDVIWSAIAGLDALVAVRLHAAITAYLTSVPFLIAGSHPKVTDFADDVGQDPRLRVAPDDDVSAARAAVTSLLSRLGIPRVPAADYIARAEHAYLGEGAQ
jgi:polysaccharide pyruvyl transferase WcaK-like protein